MKKPEKHITRTLLRAASILCVAVGMTLGLSGCRFDSANVEELRQGAWAEKQLDELSIRQQVGQTVMALVPAGADVEDPEIRRTLGHWVRDAGIGGVVFLGGDPVRQAALTSWLQQQADIPLFIAQDMEWGAGMRLAGMATFPRAMAIAATGDPRSARTVARITATQARSVGVNMVFAPVADVNTEPANPVIGTRAYGDDPRQVALFASTFADELIAGSVIPVAKHFPGHGHTDRDSHVTLPVSVRDSAALFSVDLVPFRDIARIDGAALMTGHVRLSGNSYADSLPASLSARITTDLLRDSLGFDGLVVTDALNMQGVADGRSERDILVGAVAAGNDMLLMPNDPVRAITTILDAVAAGDLSPERIEETAVRILTAKAALGRDAPGSARIDSVVFALDDSHAALEARTIARRSMTLLHGAEMLPIDRANQDILLVSVDHRDNATHEKDPLATEVDAAWAGPILHRSWSSVNGANASPELIRDAAESDLIIVADHSAGIPVRGWNASRFLDRLATSTRPIIYVAFGSPYGIDDVLDRSAATLVAWESTHLASRAAAEVLLGRSGACGKLPVHVSDRLPRGSGECVDQSAPALTLPRTAGMEPRELDAVDDIIRSAIADSAFPAAAVVVGRGRQIVKFAEYGSHTYELDRPLALDDRFDLASLTKVIATTTVVMRLVEQGLLELDRPVADYLPEFGQEHKGSVTLRDLLTHTGGLIPFRPFYARGVRSAAEVRRRIMADSLVYPPGTDYRYSDFGPITLAWVIEEVTGRSFEDVLRTEVFEPLGMVNTGFRPSRQSTDLRFVPTELDDYFRNRLIRGEVHDENAWILGGVAGHAGLFSTPGDLARFASMMVESGRIGGRQFLQPETIRLFTTTVDSLGFHTRALGWDTRSKSGYSSAGQYFGPRSFGHTGFTGTSIWMDPDQKLYVILLTNRVYPTRDSRGHIAVRPSVANRVFDAIVGRGE